MRNFYCVYIKPKEGISFANVQSKIDKALDWFKISNEYWIVYSSSSIDKWMLRLQKLVEPNGSLFVCKLDTAMKNGWMTTEFWDWMNKDRE